MTRCRHGVDFAEYTVCSECDREDIEKMEAKIERLELLLQSALPHILCETQGQNALITVIGEELEA